MAKEEVPAFDESEYDGILGGAIYKKQPGNAVIIGMKQLGEGGKLTQFIDIRTYYYNEKGEGWMPTQKGATLPVSELSELRNALERLEGLIE